MQNDRQQRTIIGATLVGFAMVFGAYVYTNFGQPYTTPRTVSNEAAAVRVAVREPIPVTDTNNNGIEDWKENLSVAAPIRIAADTDAAYEPPETLTGQFSIQFFEQAVRSKYYGSFGSNPEELAQRSAEALARTARDNLYDTSDITVVDTTDETVRAYGNRLARILIDNNVDGKGEQELLLSALEKEDPTADLAAIQTIADMYEAYRDQTLATAVPRDFVVEHLDLINTYNALYNDLDAMTLVFTDPLQTLIRVKRYEDDALGLGYALKHMYEALVPYVEVFETDDPAFLFASFNFREA